MGRAGGGSRPPPTPPRVPLSAIFSRLAGGGAGWAPTARGRRPLQAAAPPRAAPHSRLGAPIWRCHVTCRMRELAGGSTVGVTPPRRRPAHPSAAASSVVARGGSIQINDGVGPPAASTIPACRCLPVVRTRPAAARGAAPRPRAAPAARQPSTATATARGGERRAVAERQAHHSPTAGRRGAASEVPAAAAVGGSRIGRPPQRDGRACRARLVALSSPHLRGRVWASPAPRPSRRPRRQQRRPLPPPPPPHRR